MFRLDSWRWIVHLLSYCNLALYCSMSIPLVIILRSVMFSSSYCYFYHFCSVSLCAYKLSVLLVNNSCWASRRRIEKVGLPQVLVTWKHVLHRILHLYRGRSVFIYCFEEGRCYIPSQHVGSIMNQFDWVVHWEPYLQFSSCSCFITKTLSHNIIAN